VIHSLSHLIFSSSVLVAFTGTPGLLGECILNVIMCNLIYYTESKYDSSANLFVLVNGINALAIVLLSMNANIYTRLLFGSFWFMNTIQISLIFFINIAFVLFTLLWGRKYIVLSMSQDLYKHVEVQSYNLLNLTFYTLLALSCTLMYRATGIFLINAVLVLPGMVAMQWVGGVTHNFIVSICVSVFSILLSLFISLNYDIAVGSTLTLMLTLFYVLGYFITRLRK
jgi:zinc transport system permease protein